jgi:L-fuconate dehydratase
MNPDPDYSAAYVILETDQSGLEGHGLTFTIGRGNEICCAAIEAMRHLVVGLDMAWVAEDMGRFWRFITSENNKRGTNRKTGKNLAGGASKATEMPPAEFRKLSLPDRQKFLSGGGVVK